MEEKIIIYPSDEIQEDGLEEKEIDGYFATQFDDGEEDIYYNIPHVKGGKISFQLVGTDGNFVFQDKKGNKFKMFIKPIEECKENIE